MVASQGSLMTLPKGVDKDFQELELLAGHYPEAFQSALNRVREEVASKIKKNEFTDEDKDKHEKNFHGWWREAVDATRDERKEQDLDCDFYDGEQWDPEEKRELDGRGQAAIVFNRIQSTIDLVIGTEAKNRMDYKAVPKGKADTEAGRIRTILLKNEMDQNDGEYVISEAFSSQARAGIGYVFALPNDDPLKGGEVKIWHEHRRNVYPDPWHERFDGADCKYIIRTRWLDLEDAVAQFPEHKGMLQHAVDPERYTGIYAGPEQPYEHTVPDSADYHGNVDDWLEQDSRRGFPRSTWVDKERKKIRMFECWHRRPMEVPLLYNHETGEVHTFDPDNQEHLFTLIYTNSELKEEYIDKICLGLFAGPKLLSLEQTNMTRYPITFFKGKATDATGSLYGMVRVMRDPQKEVNKRRSKALFLLSSRRLVAEKSVAGTMMSHDEIEDAIDRPDCNIWLDKDGKFELDRDLNLSAEHVQLMMQALEMIEMASGVNEEVRGERSNAKSGVAINLRQQQGYTILGPMFDNLRRSRKYLGEIVNDLITQLYDRPTTVRTTDEMGSYDYIEINSPSIDPETGEAYLSNQISRMGVDIEIDEDVFRRSIREAMFSQLAEVMKSLPEQLQVFFFDVLIEAMDIPNKEEILKRVKKIQGQAMGGGQGGPPESGRAAGGEPTPPM